MTDETELTDEQQKKIEDIMQSSLGAVTTRPLPTDHGDHGASNWEADRRQRSFYAPAGDVDLYHPTSPQSAFEQLGMLPHEIESVEAEQHSRAIAAQVLTKLFTNTFRQERGERPLPIKMLRRKRGFRAWLLGALRLSR